MAHGYLVFYILLSFVGAVAQMVTRADLEYPISAAIALVLATLAVVAVLV